jgi:hypothetical protein
MLAPSLFMGFYWRDLSRRHRLLAVGGMFGAVTLHLATLPRPRPYLKGLYDLSFSSLVGFVAAALHRANSERDADREARVFAEAVQSSAAEAAREGENAEWRLLAAASREAQQRLREDVAAAERERWTLVFVNVAQLAEQKAELSVVH